QRAVISDCECLSYDLASLLTLWFLRWTWQGQQNVLQRVSQVIVFVHNRLSRVLAHELRGSELFPPCSHQLPKKIRRAVDEQAETLPRVVVWTNDLQAWRAIIQITPVLEYSFHSSDLGILAFPKTI